MAGVIKWYDTKVMAEIDGIRRIALRRIGSATVTDAKRFCPVGVEAKYGGSKTWMQREPGLLRASIRYCLTNDGTGLQVIAGSRRPLTSGVAKKFIGLEPFWALFVERGTSKMLARPYLRPAANINFPKLSEAMAGKLK